MATQRIGIEFTVDGADKVISAVKEIEAALAKMQSEFAKFSTSSGAFGGLGDAAAKAGQQVKDGLGKGTEGFGPLQKESEKTKQTFADVAAAASKAFGSGLLDGFGLSQFTSVTGAATALGQALAEAAVEGVKMAASLETTFSQIKGLTNASVGDIEGFKTAVADMSVVVGKSQKELAEAQYFIASSGFAGADSLKILDSSARAAAAGLGETKKIADLTTSVLNAYGKGAGDAANVTDVLVSAVKNGKGEPDQFASALGRVIGIAATAGVSFEELTANIATFTNVGVNVNEATTAVRAAILSLEKPSKQASEALMGIGMTAQDVRDMIKNVGLFETLRSIYEKTGGDIDTLGRIFGNVRGLAGVLGTVGTQAEAYAKNLDSARNATGNLDKAFAAAADTMEFKSKQVEAALDRVKIAFGELVITEAHSALKNLTATLSDLEILANGFKSIDLSGVNKLIKDYKVIIDLTGALLEANKSLTGLSLNPIQNTKSLFGGISDGISSVREYIGALADLQKFGPELDKIRDGFRQTKEYSVDALLQIGPLSERAANLLGKMDPALKTLIEDWRVATVAQSALADAQKDSFAITDNADAVTRRYANAVDTAYDSIENMRAAHETSRGSTSKNIEVVTAAGLALRDYSTAVSAVNDAEASRLSRMAELETQEQNLKERIAAVKKEYKEHAIDITQYGQAMAVLNNQLGGVTEQQKKLANSVKDAAKAEQEMNKAISGSISAMKEKEGALYGVKIAQEAVRLVLGQSSEAAFKEASAIAAITEAYNKNALSLSQYVKALSDVKLGKIDFDSLLNDPKFKNNQVILDAKAVLNLTADVRSDLDTRPVKQRISDQIRGIRFDPLAVEPEVNFHVKVNSSPESAMGAISKAFDPIKAYAQGKFAAPTTIPFNIDIEPKIPNTGSAWLGRIDEIVKKEVTPGKGIGLSKVEIPVTPTLDTTALAQATNAVESAKTQVASAINDGTVTAAATTMATQVTAAVATIPTNVAATGAEIPAGLATGISGNTGGLMSSIATMGDQVITAIKSVFGVASPAATMIPIGGDIDAGLGMGISNSIGLITTPFSEIFVQIGTIATTGLAMLGLNWGTAWLGLQTTTQTSTVAINSNVATFGAEINTSMSGTLAGVQSVWDTAWAAIVGNTATNTAQVQSTITTSNAAIQSDTGTAWGAIATLISGKNDEIRGNTNTTWSAITADVSSNMGEAASVVSTKANLIASEISTGWGEAQRTTTTTLQVMGTAIDTSFSNYVRGASAGMQNMNTAVRTGLSQALAVLDDAKNKTFQFGVNMMDGMTNGVRQAAGRLAEEARRAANWVLDTMKSTLGIRSPSWKTELMMKQAMQGGEIGVDKNAYLMADAAGAAAQGVLTEMERVLDIASPSGEAEKIGEQTNAGGAAGLNNSAPQVQSAAEKTWQGVLDVMKTQLGELAKTAGSGAEVQKTLGELVTGVNPQALKSWGDASRFITSAITQIKNASKRDFDAAHQLPINASKTMRNEVSKQWNAVADDIDSAGKRVRDSAGNASDGYKEAFSAGFKGLNTTSKGLFKQIEAELAPMRGGITDLVSKDFKGLGRANQDENRQFGRDLTSTWDDVSRAVEAKVMAMRLEVDKQFQGQIDAAKDGNLKNALRDQYTAAKAEVTRKAEQMRDAAQDAWREMRQNAQDNNTEMTRNTSDAYGEVRKDVSERLKEIKTAAESEWTEAKDAANKAVAEMKSKGLTDFSAIEAGLSQKAAEIQKNVSAEYADLEAEVRKKLGEIKDSNLGTWNDTYDVVEATLRKISGIAGINLDALAQRFTGAADAIGKGTNQIQQGIKDALGGGDTSKFSKQVNDLIANGAGKGYTEFYNQIKEFISGGGKVTQEEYDKILQELRSKSANIYEAVGGVGIIGDELKAAIKKVADTPKEILDKATAEVPAGVQRFTEAVELPVSELSDKINVDMGEIVKSLSSGGGGMVTAMEGMPAKTEAVFTQLKAQFGAMAENVRGNLGVINQALIDGAAYAINILTPVPAQMQQIGNDIVGGLINGMVGRLDELRSVVDSMVAIAAQGDAVRGAYVRVSEPAAARGASTTNNSTVNNNFTFPVSANTERAAIRAANVLRPRF